jgi:hypothetical protein
MTILTATLIVLGAVVVGVAAMLLVRRSAPEDSYFENGDRAAGVFGVLATGFAVLLGFVVFLAFQSYDTALSGSEAEAQLVAQQFETSQFFPVAARKPMADGLLCYARTVVHKEFPEMQKGSTQLINPWGFWMFEVLKTVQPKTASEQANYSKWLDERSDRQVARSDRTHGAEGVIPSPLWIVLFLSAIVIFVYMLLFAASGERAFVQATMMGGVMLVMSSMLLLLWFLDNPYHSGLGGLRPTAMERTLKILDTEARLVGLKLNPPCDANGAKT